MPEGVTSPHRSSFCDKKLGNTQTHRANTQMHASVPRGVSVSEGTQDRLAWLRRALAATPRATAPRAQAASPEHPCLRLQQDPHTVNIIAVRSEARGGSQRERVPGDTCAVTAPGV